jgi:Endoplasmic Reticulum Oxidoreductin 1 (ERO1)
MRDCAVCECDPKEIPVCWEKPSTTSSWASAAGVGGEDGLNGTSSMVSDAKDKRPLQLSEERLEELSRVEFEPGAVVDVKSGKKPSTSSSSAGMSPAIPGWELGQPAAQITGGGKKGKKKDSLPLPPPDVWMEEDKDSDSLQYVNLLRNPEGYTGYQGQKIWKSVYEENCFTVPPQSAASTADENEQQQCHAERVFYRLLSGVHTSINTHIAMTYNEGRGMTEARDLYEQEEAESKNNAGASSRHSKSKNKKTKTKSLALIHGGGFKGLLSNAWRIAEASVGWVLDTALGAPGHSKTTSPLVGSDSDDQPAELILNPLLVPSVELYLERIGRYPERIQNLYFVFLFAVRALAKAKPLLTRLDFNTGEPLEDERTRRRVMDLYEKAEGVLLHTAFDENTLFSAASSISSSITSSPSKHDIAALAAAAKRELDAALGDSSSSQQEGNAAEVVVREQGDIALVKKVEMVGFPSKSKEDSDTTNTMTTVDSITITPAPLAEKSTSSTSGKKQGVKLDGSGGTASSDCKEEGSAAGENSTKSAVVSSSIVAQSESLSRDLADLLERQGEANGATSAAAAGTTGSSDTAVTSIVGTKHQRLAGLNPMGKAALREMWRSKYVNISRIMDCIGCEKCRLWGKLQFLGMGTAMKIMFASPLNEKDLVAKVRLSRNEVVAFVNVLHRLSMSVAAVGVFRDLEARAKLTRLAIQVLGGVVVLVVVTAITCRRFRKARRLHKQANKARKAD